MSRDISISMYIEINEAKEQFTGFDSTEQHISYILNEACSKIEDLKCNVFYKMKDQNNKEIKLELP